MSSLNSAEGLRLRLMTLLALYDLLPYSISNPPHGAAPLTLEDAIGPDAVRRCLEAISNGHPSNIAAQLAEILRPYTRRSGNSQRSSNGHGGNRGQPQSGNAYYGSYSTSTTHSEWTR